MGICLRRIFRKPHKDFLENAVTHRSTYFAESPGYFYSADGMKKLKKTRIKSIDNSRRKVLASKNDEERTLWMKDWNLL